LSANLTFAAEYISYLTAINPRNTPLKPKNATLRHALNKRPGGGFAQRHQARAERRNIHEILVRKSFDAPPLNPV